ETERLLTRLRRLHLSTPMVIFNALTMAPGRCARCRATAAAARREICEPERLLTRLRRLHLSTPMVIFNALTMAPGRCARCRATAAAERRELAALRVPRGCAIIRTPLSAPPPRGPQRRWRRGGGGVSRGLMTKGV